MAPSAGLWSANSRPAIIFFILSVGSTFVAAIVCDVLTFTVSTVWRTIFFAFAGVVALMLLGFQVAVSAVVARRLQKIRSERNNRMFASLVRRTLVVGLVLLAGVLVLVGLSIGHALLPVSTYLNLRIASGVIEWLFAVCFLFLGKFRAAQTGSDESANQLLSSPRGTN